MESKYKRVHDFSFTGTEEGYYNDTPLPIRKPFDISYKKWKPRSEYNLWDWIKYFFKSKWRRL